MDVIVPLTDNRDFRRLYTRGKSMVSPALVTYVRKNRGEGVRVGITTSKKVGNPVTRSRRRRVIRAAFRSLYPRVAPGYDFVFVARGRTPFLKSTQICRVMAAHLREAGALR